MSDGDAACVIVTDWLLDCVPLLVRDIDGLTVDVVVWLGVADILVVTVAVGVPVAEAAWLGDSVRVNVCVGVDDSLGVCC